jgi:type IV pilus assembly protein PilA
MVKHAEAGFTKVTLLPVGLAVVCVAIAIPVLTSHTGTHHSSADAVSSTATSTAKSAIPLLGAQVDKGDDASMKSDLRTVAEEIESQNVDNQNYNATTWKTGAPPVAGSSITGTAQAVGGETVNVSPGNTITWVGSTATSYCLEATNSTGGSGSWYYSNNAGGISQTPCTS